MEIWEEIEARVNSDNDVPISKTSNKVCEIDLFVLLLTVYSHMHSNIAGALFPPDVIFLRAIYKTVFCLGRVKLHVNTNQMHFYLFSFPENVIFK